VVVTGGHLAEARDLLSLEMGQSVSALSGEHVKTRCTHGTGCAFAASIAAHLALGNDLSTAIAGAKGFVTAALQNAYQVGEGVGPVNHMYRNRSKA
jgi:hydroxymethylpyrimidine kinase/phosphomethylpyrimidine kinase